MHRLKSILYFLYDFFGLRHIWSMIRRPIEKKTGRRQPITFFLWFVGIYVALFGIASQRYENRIDIIETRINSILSQLSTPLYKKALGRIPETQRMSCPLKPEIEKPLTVLYSLFQDTIYGEGVDLLRSTVESWNDSLENVDLADAILSNGYFYKSNFNKSILSNANLSGAYMVGAKLHDASMSDAILLNANLENAILVATDLSGSILNYGDLIGSNLRKANMMYTSLIGTNFRRANMEHTVLTDAILDSANFMEAKNLAKDQLSKSYYIKYPPINIPDGIDPPPQRKK